MRIPGRGVLPSLFGVVLLLTGCANVARNEAAPFAPRSIEIGRSVENRPIEMTVFGCGRVALLIFACIHGDEIGAKAVADGLINELRRRHYELPVRILVIAESNPDGVARRSRRNARGVDLNRNFPASNWEPALHREHGAAPASEPETRALVRLIERERPAAIVTIHSITGGRECNNFDGPAEPLARLLARHNGYRVTGSIGYPTPGSFGTWAGHELGIPVVTLELPRGLTGQAAWIEQRGAIMALIEHCSAPTTD